MYVSRITLIGSVPRTPHADCRRRSSGVEGTDSSERMRMDAIPCLRVRQHRLASEGKTRQVMERLGKRDRGFGPLSLICVPLPGVRGQDMHSDISSQCSLPRNAAYSPSARRSAGAGFWRAAA